MKNWTIEIDADAIIVILGMILLFLGGIAYIYNELKGPVQYDCSEVPFEVRSEQMDKCNDLDFSSDRELCFDRLNKIYCKVIKED